MRRWDRRAFLQTSGLALAATAAGRVWATPSETPAMLTRAIPRTQEALPVIGMGTWQTFDVGPGVAERAPLEEVLRAFAALGGTLVDSSPMYGQSEEVLGALAVKTGLQPKLFTATKVWTSGKAEGLRQMEDSLRKLRTQRLDLMQVHNLVDAATHLDTLQAWKEQGRVRYVGVTHYTASAHEAVAKLLLSRPVDFVQINYSVGEREAEQRLLSVARDQGIAVIANRPFAGGGLLQRLKRKPLPPWASELDCDSWAQLLLKFVISHPAVTCAIPATSKVSHLRDNMKAGLGRLPDEKLRARIAAEAA
ncbi:aldo/keto reductase [Stigmatella aurantiaca]|uniref:Aldo/keto reductase n=1 Tax=Stigmatella aurantiaca (strain DW4/3-1) TaxID=378806 RepID=Q08P32_STIAD|nr:aldo/keto reductase [Stigmatella aurantiaca]ADO68746.1 Aldo/keto reductase family protein [Stigmatella aurantiaca DW4/3-1]EAU62241.1 aldo/keto reductase [Stigmatella aurantiaca DW4/3-1]